MFNSFGNILRLTSFGESHGKGVGGVIDGFPAGIVIDMDFVQAELDARAGRHHAPVHQRRDRGVLRRSRHALVLPLLFPAQHPARAGRCGARHRSQHPSHGGAAGVLVPVPHRVDPVGAAPLLRHRRGVHPLPGVLGTGCRTHDPLRLEGQVDGISRMKKAPLTCGQGSFLVTASQTAKTGMRCRWSAPAGRPDGPHRRGAFSSNRGSWRTALPAGRGAP